jgi:dolichol-phosphate mannosyltransferase
VVSLGRRGKGLAIRHAIATEPAEVLVFLDADGSHDPADIPRLLAPLRQGQADLVIASRVTGGSDELYCDPGHVVRALGTWMIQQTVNWWLDAQLTDIQNGFRAIRTSVARQLNLRQSGFCIEQEVAIRCLRAGHRVVNVPSHEARRDHGQSRLNLATTWFEFVSSLAGLLLDRSSDSRRSQPAPGSGRGTP